MTGRPVAQLVATVVMLLPALTAQPPSQSWFRGNTHVHTLNSDGDAPPEQVVEWYKQRRYHFVVLTDHDRRIDVTTLNARFGEPGRFLVAAGVEVHRSRRTAARPSESRGRTVWRSSTTLTV